MIEGPISEIERARSRAGVLEMLASMVVIVGVVYAVFALIELRSFATAVSSILSALLVAFVFFALASVLKLLARISISAEATRTVLEDRLAPAAGADEPVGER